MKYVILTIILLLFLFNCFIKYLMFKKPKNIDPRTKEIYNPDEYNRWINYKKESLRLSFISSIVYTLITLGLLTFNLHYTFFSFLVGLSLNSFYTNLLFLLGVNIITLPFQIAFKYYDTFVIEEKYGFNTQTKGLFIKDTIISTLLSYLIQFGIILLLNKIYQEYQSSFIIIGIIFITIFLLLVIILAPLFARLFNKFTPLKEGTLKEKIDSLMQRTNYKVNKILVMNASKRSKKMNAYFTGLGKNRRIVLYDTIIAGLDEDEIVAVLAHELGHAKHKDTLKLIPLNMISFSFIIIISYFFASAPKISTSFGFTQSNFIFSVIILLEVIEIFFKIIQIPQNWYMRKVEYRADAYSAKQYSKEYMISALKKLSKVNFADLNPHPLIVILSYNHPTLFQRIDHLEELS